MGLRQVFEARDPVWYRNLVDAHGHESPTNEPSPGDQARGIVDAGQAYYPADFAPRRWGFENCRATETIDGSIVYECVPIANPDTYNQDLRANGRIYGEELLGFPTLHGALWADEEANPLGPSTISFFGLTRQVCYPSWALGRWVFDGARGVCLFRANVSPSIEATYGGRVWYERFSCDPSNGDVWTYGVGGLGYGTAPACRLGLPDSFDPDGVEIPFTVFPEEYSEGTSGARAFAINRGRKRLAIAHIATMADRAILYRLTSDGASGGTWGVEYVRTIFAPNWIKALFWTADGLLYVHDVANFLHVWGRDGEEYQGTVRFVPSVEGSDLLVSWDRFYRRILAVEATPNEADGASTLRVRGFYPVPEATRISDPIPLLVPRKGRTIPVLVQITGDGVEPISGRTARVAGGALSAFGTSDASGNAVVRVTPTTTGDLTLTATV